MTQKTKCTCQMVVGIAGAVMSVAAWATARTHGTAGQLAAVQHHHVRRCLDDVGGRDSH